MDNKNVGWIIVGISVILIFIIFLFNSALKDIVSQSCSLVGHGDSCPMYDTITRQTFLSLGISGILILVGLILIFSKPDEKIIIKTKEIKEKKKKINLLNLDNDERKVVEILRSENGGMFQADLKDKIGIGKVGLTRLLDKLESKQIIERKRRGMNNLVILMN